MTRKVLGRGLGALIPGAPASYEATSAVGLEGADAPLAAAHAAAEGNVLEIPVGTIEPNPKQPRHAFAAETITGLADSIRAQGVLQPLLLRRSNGGYQLVAGERRLLAAKEAGLTHVPAIVREVGDEQMLEIALIENLQREDLNAIDEALAYQSLLSELQYTHESLSQRVGKNRTSITNSLRLLSLPPAVQSLVTAGTLSAGHARALLPLGSATEIEATARYVVDMGFSVRKTEALVARKLRRRITSRRRRTREEEVRGADVSVPSAYAELCDRLRRRLATQVRIVAQGTSGRIEIEYYDEGDLERLLELMGALS